MCSSLAITSDHRAVGINTSNSGQEAILQARGVSRIYANHVAVDSVSIELRRGEVLAFCGPSGSGKSTLLKLMSGLEHPDQGQVFLKEHLLSRSRLRDPSVRGRIGFVFQRPALYPNMSVVENVSLALRVVRKQPRMHAYETAMEALRHVGLTEKSRSYPETLSGGQQQRVSIARALALDPEVLLLDEPTSALDPEWVHEVLDVLRKLASQGTTMAVATHELAFAREFSNRVAFLDNGRNLETTETSRFFASPSTQRAARFLKAVLNP